MSTQCTWRRYSPSPPTSKEPCEACEAELQGDDEHIDSLSEAEAKSTLKYLLQRKEP